jgi:nucleotide-binding universal stress UspA family protein
MKTILLPTDFSKNSLNAIDFAMKMFEGIDCTFYILNIQKASSFVSDDLMTASPSVNLYQAIIDTAKKSLDNLISTIKSKHNNVKHELIPIVDYDNFIDAINQICEVNKIEMIIMGTKGASGLEKTIFGSNTVRVMQRGTTPILAIPDDYKYKHFKKAAFLSNYLTAYRNDDLSVFLEIIGLHKPRVDVLHVSQGEPITAIQKENIKLLDDFLAEVSHDFIDLKGNDVYKEVNNFIKLNKIDLLAMVNRKHSFFERFLSTQKVEDFGFNTDIPFLVMHKQESE